MTSRGTAAGARLVLICNAGSSTLKASLLAPGDERPVGTTTIGWDGDPVERAAATLETALTALGPPEPRAISGVGHRLVHGGPDVGRPVIVDAAVRRRLEAVRSLAPLHLPPALAVLDAARARLPGIPHVAAFDTAFHVARPEIDQRYPLPSDWVRELDLRRYGFHGLSVEWATSRAAIVLGSPGSRLRLVVAHLGAGSSVTAVDRGRSVHTSMGYTPLEGLVMATRSGSIDPGVVIALLRAGHDVEDVADGLEHRSGLLGLAGEADMAALVDRARAGEERARLAIDLYVDRAAAAIGAAATRLPTLDAVVFTGGIGEHATTVRAAIVRRLATLGVAPIPARRWSGDVVLSAAGQRPAVLRVEAREDLVIGAAVWRLIRTSGA